MDNLNEGLPELKRKVLTMFFLVDASGSMTGNPIGMLNAGIEESLPTIRDLSDKNDDCEIKIAVLQFSTGCQWLTPEGEPQSVSDYKWHDITAGGMTEFGEALKELNSKMSRNALFKNDAGNKEAVIILITDGEPTDEWQKPLEDLKQNAWFKHAIKIALNINSNIDVLEKFTGNRECIIDIHNQEALKKLIKIVSVTSSRVGSTSVINVDTEGAAKQVIEQTKDAVEFEGFNVDDSIEFH